ncbi:hypothetical protein EDD11_008230 [Mortierella claussenii]|nr:hypothetical protein EDD11_008230 [Mortierella claussenii]
MVAHTVLYWLASQGATATTAAVAAASSTAQDDSGTPLKIYLSNIAGSLSILCWFIVFTPQFWINYKRQSGESLSLVFLYIWLAGDIMNLIGATMENLLLTMIALIAQIFYYRRTSVKASFESVLTHANPESFSALHEHGHTGEHAPLMTGASIAPNYSSIAPSEHVHENEHDRVIHQAAMVANATASHYAEDHAVGGHAHSGEHPHRPQRRPSAHSTLTTSSGKHRSKAAKRRKMVRKVMMVLFPIVLVAVFVWAYYDWLQCTVGDGESSEEGSHCGRGHNGGHGKLPPSPSHPGSDNDTLSMMMSQKKGSKKHPGEDNGRQGGEKSGFQVWIPLLLGWGSALLYLGSRLPQIYKNWRLKSCEGLSIMMFVFSVFGNVFYVASIFLNSMEIDYLIRNMPWWLGSGGTLVFDFTIFFQFYIYRYNNPLSEALKEAAAAGELDENALLATADNGEDETTEEDTDSDSSSTTPSGKMSRQNQTKSSKGQHAAPGSDVTSV